MIVQVRILKNEKEINEVLQENAKKANQRVHENQKTKRDRVEVLPDLEVPEKIIVLKNMAIDASKVDMITESAIDETYELMYFGKGFQIVEDVQVWNKVVECLKEREKPILCKRA